MGRGKDIEIFPFSQIYPIPDHSPPASAEVKKMWIYTSTPPYAFVA
jgi:hypothetical protein